MPKTVIWEQSPGITMATLFSRLRQFVQVDLYTLTLVTGQVLRYATGDRDVGYLGNTWSSKQVRIDDKQAKARAVWKVGLDVATWQVPVYPRPYDDFTGGLTFPDKVGSTPFVQACIGGALDNATVTVDRAILAKWSDPPVLVETPVGVYRMFTGWAAAIDNADNGIILNINSYLDRLNQPMPWRLFQAGCIHTLFDVGCTLNPASFNRTGSAGVGTDNLHIKSGIAAPPGSGTFVLGRLLMTSGLNAGLSRLVRAWDGVTFTLAAPFYFTVAVGDNFTAYAGCNKLFATCVDFGNQVNYGGQRFIPAPEVAV